MGKPSKKKISADDFEGVWVDINGLTAKEWKEIEELAREVRNSGNFKGDPFKCTIGAFVLWVAETQSVDEVGPDGEYLH